MNRGITYIAIGKRYLTMAERSAEKIKKDVDENICIITDMKQKKVPDVFDRYIQHPDPNRKPKPSALHLSPWDQTLYLDCDAFIQEPVQQTIDELFELLNGVSIAAMQPARSRIEIPEERDPKSIAPKAYQQYNTGVMVFDAGAQALLEKWNVRHREYEQGENLFHDQASFRDVAYTSNCRIGTLPAEYNYHAGGGGYQYLSERVKIIHGDLSDKALDEVYAKINNQSHTKMRVRGYEIVSIEEDALIKLLNPLWKRWIRKLILLIRNRGIYYTINIIIEYYKTNINEKN